MDKLFESVAAKGHVCVGIDTAPDYIPPAERQCSLCEAVLSFNKAIINATFDCAACYKVQIAYYEEMGLSGLSVYAQTLRYIREKGSLVIADIKRGDIADTAARYAKAHFSGDFEADFVTLSPYMGMDTIEPWLEYADMSGKGAFILMRTSNKGMCDFEFLNIVGGSLPLASNASALNADAFSEKAYNAPPPARRLYHAVGDKLAELAAVHSGKYGYGAFGAVIGCTVPASDSFQPREEAAEIRRNYPNLFFLIPGYGAQGGSTRDAALLLQNGNGGVINASRSILKAWTAELAGANELAANNAFAAEAARCAVIAMRDEIRDAAGKL